MKQIRQQKKHSTFFDAALFRYVLKTVFKRASIYVSTVAYLIMIFSIIFIAPSFGDLGPIEIITNPIVSAFLMFGCSVIAALFMIEIFRTPIEDGTEILTVSKPLSRLEIVLVKIASFILMLFMVAFLATLVSLFLFIQVSNLIEGLYIVIGIFSGTVITCFIFGGLTLILLIYARKIVALMLVFAISFSFTIFSVFVALFAKNPIQVINRTNDSISYINTFNLDKDALNNNEYKINSVSGFVSNNTSKIGDAKTPEQIYNDAVAVATWNTIRYVDFGTQLSSLFYSNKASSTSRYSTTVRYYTTPSILEFYDYDNSAENISSISFGINSFDQNDNIKTIINKTFSFAGAWWFWSSNKNVNKVDTWVNSPSEYFLNKSIDSSLFETYWNKYGDQVIDEYKYFYNNVSTNTNYQATEIMLKKGFSPLSVFFYIIGKNEFNLNKWDNNDFYSLQKDLTWSCYSYLIKNLLTETNPDTNQIIKKDINIFDILDVFHLDDELPNLFYSTKDVALKEFIPNYDAFSSETKNNINQLFGGLSITENTTIKEIQDKANEIADKDQNSFFYKTRENLKQNKVKNILLLNAVGIDVKGLINVERENSSFVTTWTNNNLNISLTNYFSNYINQYGAVSFAMDKSYANDNTTKYLDVYLNDESFWYDYYLPIRNADSNYYSLNSFQTANVVQLNDSKVLYPVWIAIGLILFIIGCYLYYKKDFA